MKKIISAALLLACLSGAQALAAPSLQAVIAGDAAMVSGQDGWAFQFQAGEGGTLCVELLSTVGRASVEAGPGSIGWNGLLADGTPAPAGDYMVQVWLMSDAGEASESSLFPLHIFESEQEKNENTLDLSTLVAEEAAVWEEATFEDVAAGDGVTDDGVPVATSFWDMNPDDYDLTNPAHQQAIWDLMMQPITVIDGEQTENIYITNAPGINRTPYAENCAGELHGQSQGVHVLEEDTDGDGYVRIEAYTNDGTKTENSYMESIAASKVQGYIKASRLYQVTPSDEYALLIDKLRQKLYVFEAGQIITSLDVSTGLNTKSQPYNETPAGEFLTVSRVGDFNAGSGTIGRYAIRINGGTLIHEVLHDVGADGTKIYSDYEPQLGYKASHGCIRIPRRKNADGFNMQWFWENLPLKTKVFIWEDKGRQMYEPELPDADLPLYRNPDGGSNYHTDQNCPGVRDKFLPLTGDFTYGDLDSDAFKKLTPCAYCAAPQRREELYNRYVAAAEQIGAEITDEIKAIFGVE